MSQCEYEATILLLDITGSTPLYEEAGDAAALHQVNECLDALRRIVHHAGGTEIHSKGDDLLCVFDDPSSALTAVREVHSQRLNRSLAIHAGMNFGHIIRARGDIFGDAVNLTARLAALAKPGEVLVSQSFVDQLPEGEAGTLRFLDNFTFKGKSAPTTVYSLLEETAAPLTDVSFPGGPGSSSAGPAPTAPDTVVTLRYKGRTHTCPEEARLVIGRAPGCDLVIAKRWVSRNHATVAVRRGKVELGDQSTSGTYVTTQDGSEVFLHRETLLLSGSGTISPAVSSNDERAEIVAYEVDATYR